MTLPGWKGRLRNMAERWFVKGQRDANDERRPDPFQITTDGGPRWWSTVPRLAYDAGFANPVAREIPPDAWAEIVAERVCPR